MEIFAFLGRKFTKIPTFTSPGQETRKRAPLSQLTRLDLLVVTVYKRSGSHAHARVRLVRTVFCYATRASTSSSKQCAVLGVGRWWLFTANETTVVKLWAFRHDSSPVDIISSVFCVKPLGPFLTPEYRTVPPRAFPGRGW